MSANDASSARPPPNRIAGDSARARVVATTISTWLVSGASASEGTGVRKPSEVAQPASPRATRPARPIWRAIGAIFVGLRPLAEQALLMSLPTIAGTTQLGPHLGAHLLALRLSRRPRAESR